MPNTRKLTPLEAALSRFSEAHQMLALHVDDGGYMPDDDGLSTLINDAAIRIEEHIRRANGPDSYSRADWISEHRLGAFEYLGVR